MNPDSVLEVRGVTVRFGGLTALDAVSLAVPPRHVLGVIGPNGAGKTTLLNVLCGFIRPDAGEVRYGGRRHDVRPHRLAGLGVARTLQGVGLYAGLTADIYAYWRAHTAFPDEPTSQQFFAEPQFEAYRALGQQIIAGLLGTVLPADVGAWFASLRATS